MKRLILLIALTISIHAEDSILTKFYDNAAAANESILYTENNDLIPTITFPSYDPWTGTTQRITYLTVVPHSPNSYDTVPSLPLPLIQQDSCRYVCKGTLNLCTVMRLNGALQTETFLFQSGRDAAYNSLPVLSRNYAAKLSLFSGNGIRYVLIYPGFSVIVPDYICGAGYED